MPYCSSFSHDDEVAVPGYYSVYLSRYGVRAELTATCRAAIHRYTYPATSGAGMILDLDYSLQRQTNRDMLIEQVNDSTLRGRKRTAYWAPDQPVCFYMVFSRPFTFRLVNDTLPPSCGASPRPRMKALLRFAPLAEGEQVMVKTGLSAVDMEGARANVEQEIPGWDFDGVRRAAAAAWNRELSRIEVRTADPVRRRVFYTGLYHALIAPTVFSDVDGRYLGMDHNIRRTKEGETYYTIFSLWDTFRALHPLLTILRPELNAEMIRSLIAKSEEGGIYPSGTWRQTIRGR